MRWIQFAIFAVMAAFVMQSFALAQEAPEEPKGSPFQDLAENPDGTKGNPDDAKEKHEITAFKNRRAARGGGTLHSVRIVAALEWLKDHQSVAGNWRADKFSTDSSRKGAMQTGNAEFKSVGDATKDVGWANTTDVGLTGLALMAFTSSGYDHKAGDYKRTIRNGVKYLRKIQSNDGCFGKKDADHFVYNHALATVGMAEVYGLSNDKVLKPTTQRATQFIELAQNPGMGWRYGVKAKANDSSVTGWMVLAMRACEMSEIEADYTTSYKSGMKWFDQVTVEVNGYPKTGYMTPGSGNARLRQAANYDQNPTMDAIHITAKLMTQSTTRGDKTLKSQAKGCVEKDHLPTWKENKIDYYYWYFGTMATYQYGGSIWKSWNKALAATLLDAQRGFNAIDKKKGFTTVESLDEHGSWDPVGAWGSAGGRVFSTCMACLALQTASGVRYERTKDELRKVDEKKSDDSEEPKDKADEK